MVAGIVDAAPKRLVRKLDKNPRLAEGWTWASDAASTTVTTDSGERVSLPADVRATADVACTCLLAPRCLHVLAVVSLLRIGEEQEPASSDVEAVVRPTTATLTDEQRAAARELWRAACDVLSAGATAAGSIAQAELLRAVHSCRVVGLHRASAAGVRVVRSIRDLREDKPEFRLENLVAEFRDALLTSFKIMDASEIDRKWLGTARRSYAPAGNLRLHGLFAEAVISGSGFSGVVTYLVDDSGGLFTVSDVLPGGPEQVRGGYRTGDFAGVPLSPEALCRAGLFVNQATASADNRLGRGANVQATSARGASWFETPLNELWSAPLGAQLGRHRQWSTEPPVARPAGWNLVFLDGVVLGTSSLALAVEANGGVYWARSPSEHPAVAYRHNLQMLGRAAGLRLRLIGRLRTDAPRSLDLLAVAPGVGDAAEETRLELSDELAGRINLGLDELAGSHIRQASPKSLREPASNVDPVAGLRRRVARVALGGRTTLRTAGDGAEDIDVRRLRARMMPTAAAVFTELLVHAQGIERDALGARTADSAAFARAWLRASSCEYGIASEIARGSWDPR